MRRSALVRGSALLRGSALVLACGACAEPPGPTPDELLARDVVERAAAVEQELLPELAALHTAVVSGDPSAARGRAFLYLKQPGANQHQGAYLIGLSFEEELRYEAARLQYRRSTAEQPGFLPSWKRLGMCHHELGDLDSARTALSAFLAARPDDAEARLRLGVVELDDGRAGTAEGHLTAALEQLRALGPRTAPQQLARCLLHLGDLHLAREQLAPAAGSYEESLQVASEGWRRRPEVQYKLGQVYLRQGRAEEARELLSLAEEGRVRLNRQAVMGVRGALDR